MLRDGFVCNLPKILDESGVKQKKLCEITGLKASAISSIVRGESDPPTTTSIIIAEFFGKRVEEIWKRKEITI
jgi:DNA-binding XRE family transcriptional regulator